MKRTFFSLLAISSPLFLFSCKEKSYTCNCTYVYSAFGPDSTKIDTKLEETNTVKGRIKEDADIDCTGMEGKYINQFYNGTCLIQ